MVDENKTGTEQAGDADQKTGNDVTAGGQQDVTQDAAGNQDEVEGLKAAAKAEREKRQTAETEAQNLRDQVALMNANPAQVQTQTQQPLSTFEQAMADCGTTAEELSYDGAMQVKVQNRKEQLEQIKQSNTQQLLANQQFVNTHSDYGEVVGRTGPTGQTVPSAEITEILQRKPHLTASAFASAQGAYNVVMDERKLTKFEKDQAALEEHQKRAGIDTETQPLGGSAAGGGAAGDIQQKMMSREQVREVEAKLAQGEAV